jgi:glutamate-5-semialdehyde dehydrogenase
VKSSDLTSLGKRARFASKVLARQSDDSKKFALDKIASSLESNHESILLANQRDIQIAKDNALNNVSVDRLLLDREGLQSIANDVRTIAALPDPLAEKFDERTLSNGLNIARKRTPLGVIGVIYESRPNVTIDISALCLKSGNAAILRGGSEAIHSNTALVSLIKNSLDSSKMPLDSIQFVNSPDRKLVDQMLKMKDYIDLMVPRGNSSLVHKVASEATMPAITGGIGVCHMYVDDTAELDMAINLARSSKVEKPYVCNALDTVLVHSSVAPTYLPRMANVLGESDVELRCDLRALSLLGNPSNSNIIRATDLDWGAEFLALKVAIKVVDSLQDALDHINIYGSGHTDVIVTENTSAATRFLNEVDSSVVIVNASTRYNDGGRLGLGAEVAISTNKLHARGPMGLKELTSYKWTIEGTGQTPG